MSEMDPVLIILALIFGGGNVLAMLWGKRSDAVLPAPLQNGMKKYACGPHFRLALIIMSVCTACLFVCAGIRIYMISEDLEKETVVLVVSAFIMIECILVILGQLYSRRISILFNDAKLIFYAGGLRGRVVRWEELAEFGVRTERGEKQLFFRMPGEKTIEIGESSWPGFSDLAALIRNKKKSA